MAKVKKSEERDAQAHFKNELIQISNPRTSVEIEDASGAKMPALSSTIPASSSTVPASRSTMPASRSTMPASRSTMPASRSTMPASRSTMPASSSTMAEGPDPSSIPAKSEFPEDKDSKTTVVTKPKKDENPKTPINFKELPYAEQKVHFGTKLSNSFVPLKFLMLVLGRFPLSSQKNKALGTTAYKWTWIHPNCIYFMFTSVVTIYVLLLGTLNTFDIQMETDILNLANFNLTQQPKPSKGGGKFKLGSKTVTGHYEVRQQIGGFNYEKIIFERHVATFALIWGLLVHSVVASINFVTKREYAVMYFSFWYRAVQTMHMDVTALTRRKTLTMTIGYSLILVILTLFAVFKVGPSSHTSPTLFGMLMFREYFPPLFHLNTTTKSWNRTGQPNLTTFTYYSIINNAPTGRPLMALLGGLFLLLLFAGSITHMFLFVYKCDLLKNAFANWNGRLYAVVVSSTEDSPKKVIRSSYELLFRDHCVLLDLMEGNDRLFAGCVESYYAVQIVTLFFQMYFMIRVSIFGEDRKGGAAEGRYYIRPFDWAPAFVLLALSVMILICVTLAASEVGEEAMAGLEILRRKSLLHRKTDEELYFTLSMLSSYTSFKHLEVAGAGYCYFNKEFLIAIVSTIFSYFIIIFQFQPSLDHQTQGDLGKREVAGKFLSELEGILPLDHWKP